MNNLNWFYRDMYRCLLVRYMNQLLNVAHKIGLGQLMGKKFHKKSTIIQQFFFFIYRFLNFL